MTSIDIYQPAVYKTLLLFSWWNFGAKIIIESLINYSIFCLPRCRSGQSHASSPRPRITRRGALVGGELAWRRPSGFTLCHKAGTRSFKRERLVSWSFFRDQLRYAKELRSYFAWLKWYLRHEPSTCGPNKAIQLKRTIFSILLCFWCLSAMSWSVFRRWVVSVHIDKANFWEPFLLYPYYALCLHLPSHPPSLYPPSFQKVK